MADSSDLQLGGCLSSFETGSKPNANDKCVLSGKSNNGERGISTFLEKIAFFILKGKKWRHRLVRPLFTDPSAFNKDATSLQYAWKIKTPLVTIHKSIIIWFDWMTQLIIGVTIHQSHILVAMNSVRFLYKKKKKSQNSFY